MCSVSLSLCWCLFAWKLMDPICERPKINLTNEFLFGFKTWILCLIHRKILEKGYLFTLWSLIIFPVFWLSGLKQQQQTVLCHMKIYLFFEHESAVEQKKTAAAEQRSRHMLMIGPAQPTAPLCRHSECVLHRKASTCDSQRRTSLKWAQCSASDSQSKDSCMQLHLHWISPQPVTRMLKMNIKLKPTTPTTDINCV